METGTLYLFPVNLSEAPLENVLPEYNKKILANIRYFIVENIRTARRFLRKCDNNFDIDSSVFYTLNVRTKPETIFSYLDPIKNGHNIGIISEAGCPAIADPGADIVSIAQTKGYRIVPLVGPSSILLSLMASGFNGQRFTFEGYLPVENDKRIKAIKKLEERSLKEDSTHIFIETPYRNMKMMADLVSTLNKGTKICVAYNITGENEYIKTKAAGEWKKEIPTLEKKPCIFLIYAR